MDGDRNYPSDSDETDQIQGNSAHAQMEVSLSSIAFKGSVTQAIVAAKIWRKILLVYIGDPGEMSVHLEQSTLRDSEVVKLLSEYCVVLHLLEGSMDVVHFSAFCPHKSAPALSAIGYNGSLLWQYEGYISANDLIASIEKARTDLHSQEVVSNLVSSEHEGNLNTAEPYPSSGEIHSQQSSISQTMSESTWGTEETVQTEVSCRDDGQEDMASTSIISASATPNRPSNASSSKCDSMANSTQSSTSIVEKPRNLAFSNQKITDPTCVLVQTKESADASPSNLAENNSQRGNTVSPGDTNIGGEMLKADDELFREKTINVASLGLEQPTAEIVPERDTGDQGTSHVIADINNGGEMLEADDQSFREQTSDVASLDTEQPTTEIVPNGEMGDQGSSHVMDDQSARRLPTRDSSSIYLQIRLLNGSSLQAKFQATDTLRRVKDYVNENWTDGNKAFSLAIPYPRKVFGQEDMGKVLSELNLGTRVAMILVPFGSATSPSDWRSSSQANNMGSPSSLQNREASPGLFARILSYFNPFSYFSGTSTNQDSMSRDSVWQYGPNPSLQSAFKDGSQNSSYMSRSNTPGKDQKSSGNSKVEKKGWGSNIHTLNHDEDESFRDRNAFWNGNSTQYGGDDSKRD